MSTDPCPTCGRTEHAGMTDAQVREDDGRIAADLETLATYLRLRHHTGRIGIHARERAILRARSVLHGLVAAGLL